MWPTLKADGMGVRALVFVLAVYSGGSLKIRVDGLSLSLQNDMSDILRVRDPKGEALRNILKFYFRFVDMSNCTHCLQHLVVVCQPLRG